MKRIAILAVAAALIVGFFYYDLHHLLTLDTLKSSVTDFRDWQASYPFLTGAFFVLFYIFVTMLSLPGAAVMTLAAGALFGLFWGTILVSFASSIGATLAFLASRYLFRDALQNRYGDRLKALNRGIAKDGAFYLFSLRLVPVFPFFLINILMGLTPIRTITFYWVSQVGMLAGTMVYVNAGTQLVKVDSLSDILSPGLLLSFILLGAFPLIAKGFISIIRARRIYAGYRKPRYFDRNLIIIGGGAAGLVSAYIAATVKAKVTLIEAEKMGGDCLNYGCIPSKALIRSARLAHQMRQAEHYGLERTEPRFSFKTVMARVHHIIKTIEPADSVERYTALGVDVVKGYAKLIDPWTVEISASDGSVMRLTSRAIILATGAQPYIPPLPGIDETGYVTSDTLWDEFAELDVPPQRLLVLGGGPMGCELAQCFAQFGSDVTLVERAERLMIREDKEVSSLVKDCLTADGITVLTDHEAIRFEKTTDGDRVKKCLIVTHKGTERAIVFDSLLCAVGRTARLEGYGLKELGIDSNKVITTNDYLQTLYPNIYAAGDVAGPYQFTHAASHQAWHASVNALFGHVRKFKVDYQIIPQTTFIDPEIARVGLNEQEAQENGIAYEITRYNLDHLDRAVTEGATKGFIKVLTVPGKDRILGVTIVSEHGGELIAEFVVAMKYGLGLNKLLSTIRVYPTWSEANKFAAGEWKHAHAPHRLLALLKKYHNWRRGSARTGAVDR